MGSIDTNLVLEVLEDPNNAIVAIQAPTGSGKSTVIPVAIARTGMRIFVGVPTNAAARSLSSYIGKTHPELTVGYGSEGEKNYTDQTLLVYMTHGHMLNLLLSGIKKGVPENFPDIHVLMVDEAHTGTLEVTLILRLWVLYTLHFEQLYEQGLSELGTAPLLISSATLDGMNLTPVRDFEIESIEFSLQSYPIQIRYSRTTPKLDSQDLYSQLARKAADLYQETGSGHGLIFVAGASEAEATARKIRDQVPGAKVLTAFGSMGGEALQEIMEPSQERKIIITTNVMESALTVENVTWVLDSMTEKVPEASSTGGIRLVTVYESKSSATQRCGRTGRTGPGICFRMCTEAFYESLSPIREEEINRMPIFSEVMALINVGLVPAKVLPQVPAEKLLETQNLLEQQGMLQENQITEMGRLASRLPLGIRTSRLVYEWVVEGLPIFPGLVLATMIDNYGPNYFYLPRKGRMDTLEYNNLLIETYPILQEFGGPDPLEAYLGVMVQALAEFESLSPNVGQLNRWAQQNSLNARKLREVFSILKRVDKGVTKFFKTDYDLGLFTVEGVLRGALPILEQIYSDRIMTRTRGMDFLDSNGNKYRLRGTGAYPDFKAPPKVLALDLLETQQQGRVFRSIVLWTTTEAELIQEEIEEDVLEELDSRFDDV